MAGDVQDISSDEGGRGAPALPVKYQNTRLAATLVAETVSGGSGILKPVLPAGSEAPEEAKLGFRRNQIARSTPTCVLSVQIRLSKLFRLQIRQFRSVPVFFPVIPVIQVIHTARLE
ncbi:hypothetical protein L1987_01645 [Smallanthus sonchifolius]|uniref:Uncharacterized protein n=1 Tax=Smallanthus sonchifolius TaxID=185202 RepID=A0ACB9K5M4_9ASTR|nr:hypothetical protein L1987_01645 [Smallanthus sonchifolius]